MKLWDTMRNTLCGRGVVVLWEMSMASLFFTEASLFFTEASMGIVQNVVYLSATEFVEQIIEGGALLFLQSFQLDGGASG